MKSKILGLLAVALLVGPVVAQATIWNVDFLGGVLVGANEVPPNASTATGGEAGAGFQYDDALGSLSFSYVYGLSGFQPLLGDFTATHIHNAAAGVNGPVVAHLTTFNVANGAHAGTVTGLVPLGAFASQLFAGNLYLNVHSTLFPGGEIRAQLVVPGYHVPEPGTLALLGLGLVGLGLSRRRKA